MPFAVQCRRVACVGKQLPERVLPGCEAVLTSWLRHDGRRSRAHGVTTRHDRRTRRRALCFNVVVIEAYALACKFIDSRRCRRAAIDAEVSPSDIVDQKEDD